MAVNRKQHYIPQCYLKNFSQNEINIQTLDIQTNKFYSSPISGTCCFNFFYSFPDSTYDIEKNTPVNSLYAEKTYFADNIEVKYGNMLNSIISSKEQWIGDSATKPLNIQDKYLFARLIAIQWFRLKQFRDSIDNLESSFIDGVLDLFIEGLEQEQSIHIDYKEKRTELIQFLKGDAKLNHANLGYMNENLIDTYATYLAQNYWEFFVSTNDIYTSDNPINVYPHFKNARPICEGLASYATEVSFPISKDILLIIWEKEYFKDKEDKDCSFSYIDKKLRIKNNNIRYIYAKRQLFSFDGKFNDITIKR